MPHEVCQRPGCGRPMPPNVYGNSKYCCADCKRTMKNSHMKGVFLRHCMNHDNTQPVTAPLRLVEGHHPRRPALAPPVAISDRTLLEAICQSP